MKPVAYGLLMLLSLYAGTCRGEEYAQLSANTLNTDINAYRVQLLGERRGYLEKTRLAIGTILKSHHFSRNDYNETHNGIYLSVDRWSLGSYINSGYEQSVFVTYNPDLYRSRSLGVNLVAGIANGYEDWDYAQGDYLPILGVSAQWTYLKTLVSVELIAVGFELPLN